jgi:hypothetical protein
MNKSTQAAVALIGLLTLTVGAAACSSPASPTKPAIEIDIDVAPNVLNIASQGEVVTVHTDLLYSSVAASSVSLNGVTISSWKADNQGEFVAKFLMTAVKDLPLKIDALNTITLRGTTTDETPFSGSQDILVVNNASQP